LVNRIFRRASVRFLLVWLPPVLWMAVIFFFSSLPASDAPSFLPDYVFHFFEYAVLSSLFLRAFRKQKKTSIQIPLWVASLSIVYAASDELHQFFVSTRCCSFKDFAVDTLAVLFVVLIAGLFKRER